MRRHVRLTTAGIVACALLACGPALSSSRAQEAIFVVRHAERLDDSRDSPLSPEGRARAERLAQMLRDAGITAIYVSEFQRTAQTAQPLADLLKLPLVKTPATDEPALLSKMRASGPRARVLVVSHSDRMPALLHDLGDPHDVTIAANQYDDVFLVGPRDSPGASLVMRLHY